MANRDFQATVEDHYSDGDERPARPPPEVLRKSPSANVAAKRSHHSDLGNEKPVVLEPPVNIDLRSDSGYSTHTTATMSSSADSATSAKASSPPTAPSSAASYPTSSPPVSKRRPTLVADDRKTSTQGSPRKSLQRTTSSASKRPASTRRSSSAEDCRDPDCTKCGPSALPQRSRKSGREQPREPPRLTPLDSGLDVSFPSDQRSQRSDPAPASYASPSSPTFTRQRPPYQYGSALVQPAQTRRRSSSNARQRPMSYHEGQQYWQSGMPGAYPSPPQEHGPPPAMSAHFNMQYPPQQMNPYPPAMMPPNGSYYPPVSMGQTPPPYEQQRSTFSARGPSNPTSFSTRRGSKVGPTITYGRDDQPMPSARFHNSSHPAPRSTRQERFPDAEVSESESEGEYDSQYDDDEEEEPSQPRYEQALVPHRKLKTRRDTETRPPLRKANTTQVYNDRRKSFVGMSQSTTLPERPRERDPRASRASTAAPSRAQSKVRPALVQQPKSQSAYDTSRPARVMVEDKSRRSRSYQAYEYENDYDKEHLAEQKRRNRASKLYMEEQDDRDYRASREDAIIVPERRRRDTATSVSRHNSEYIVQAKPRQTAMDAAEAYQQRARGTNEPLADAIHKAAKRASRIPSNPSETSDDRKTRISQSARTTVTNGGNGEIRLRVDASAPLSLQFNGDMEGRTLQINPAEGGMADIVIGSSRGEESVYRSEKGSHIGNRQSIVGGATRRQLEEQSQSVSVRSSRSGQTRRDRGSERRVFKRQTDYH